MTAETSFVQHTLIRLWLFQVGLDKAINNLTTPLGQLKKEVLVGISVAFVKENVQNKVVSCQPKQPFSFSTHRYFFGFQSVQTAMDEAIGIVQSKLNLQAKIRNKKVDTSLGLYRSIWRGCFQKSLMVMFTAARYDRVLLFPNHLNTDIDKVECCDVDQITKISHFGHSKDFETASYCREAVSRFCGILRTISNGRGRVKAWTSTQKGKTRNSVLLFQDFVVQVCSPPTQTWTNSKFHAANTQQNLMQWSDWPN